MSEKRLREQSYAYTHNYVRTGLKFDPQTYNHRYRREKASLMTSEILQVPICIKNT